MTMNATKLAVIGGALISLMVAVAALGYVVTVGIVWVILRLAELTFAVQVDWNVWILGLMVYLALWLIKALFSK